MERGRRGRLGAFTLIEMLTTVAALVILLGLMVSLARHVRARSADTLTRDLLVRLDRELAKRPELLIELNRVPLLVDTASESHDEAALQRAAAENSRAFVRVWRMGTGGVVVRDQPVSIYDEATLRDAWGTPIVYVAAGKPNVGIAPQGRAFFLSAGPDRRFITLLDNLYSYEYSGGAGWQR
jgi:hypothetical protein